MKINERIKLRRKKNPVSKKSQKKVCEVGNKSDVNVIKQVAQLSQRERAAVWVSCGPNINIVFRIQRTLLYIAVAIQRFVRFV